MQGMGSCLFRILAPAFPQEIERTFSSSDLQESWEGVEWGCIFPARHFVVWIMIWHLCTIWTVTGPHSSSDLSDPINRRNSSEQFSSAL